MTTLSVLWGWVRGGWGTRVANHAQRAAAVDKLLCEHTQTLGATSTVLGVLFIAVGSASQRVTCDVMILHAVHMPQ